MFTTKKPTLIESSIKLLEKSKEIKSIFIKLKERSIDTNIELMDKASELSYEAQALVNQRIALSDESIVNENVINNIDNILGIPKSKTKKND